ncbi:MAG: acyloxyacyl hydrolase, partial [Hyphomicrobiaceae bacterium]|nr:acyloxyacyl hydrolase [Hyphomicrobiaceae bacterium]
MRLACGRARAGMGTGAALGLTVALCPAAWAAPPDLPPLFAVSEIKIGALEHDTPGLWSGFSRERAAADANFEILFAPWAATFGGYLRPAIGATINFNGDTSKAYADLRWEIEAPWGVFFAIGLGAAIHDGHLSLDAPDRKALGAPVLFHPSAELGYRFDTGLSISLFADHMSNGFSRRYNEGMDTVGARMGYRFSPATPRATTEGPLSEFSGPYIGAFAGAKFENADWLNFSGGATAYDFAWGGFAGYLWQSGRGVFGIETDASPLKTSLSTGCIGPAIDCRMEVDGTYSVRARFGWVFGPALLYGTAGLAIAPWRMSIKNPTTAVEFAGSSSTAFGVAVGAGTEVQLAPHLGLRAEIMHYGVPM